MTPAEKPTDTPPVDNDHVAEGCGKFSESKADTSEDEEPKPRRSLLEILRDIISGPKEKHVGHYQVKVDEKHLAEAHDAIAAAKDE